MGNVGQLVIFVVLGALFLSWGFDYSMLEIVSGVLLFIASLMGYFHWEERQRKKKSLELKSKAVPSQNVAQASMGMGDGAARARVAVEVNKQAPFHSEPPLHRYVPRTDPAGARLPIADFRSVPVSTLDKKSSLGFFFPKLAFPTHPLPHSPSPVFFLVIL